MRLHERDCAEREAAAATWSRLRRENAPVRVMRDGYPVSALLTHYDADLAAQASDGWDLLIRLIARTIDDLGSSPHGPGQACYDEFLFARIFALVGRRAGRHGLRTGHAQLRGPTISGPLS